MKVGDKVKLSPAGLDLKGGAKLEWALKRGTIVRKSRKLDCFSVLWDGERHNEVYLPAFIDIAEPKIRKEMKPKKPDERWRIKYRDGSESFFRSKTTAENLAKLSTNVQVSRFVETP